MGWHLGHIAFTESYWILERCAGEAPQFPQYQKLFAADGLPKVERQDLPPWSEIVEYLETVRDAVLRYLEVAPWQQQERLWWWLLQHECQHSETIAVVLQLQCWNPPAVYPGLGQNRPETPDMVEIQAGEFIFGSNTHPQDNIRPAHRVYLDRYFIDRYPVTCAQYREFIEAGGYQNRDWWTSEGWEWLQSNPVARPLYWLDSRDWEQHPVCGVSWYEATAYAHFVGKRLPTEAEWEKAASWDEALQAGRRYPWGNAGVGSQLCNCDGRVGHTTPVNAYPAGVAASGCWDMLGNVWEWTASPFAGYPGFKPYPYRGYSQNYFDEQHRVMRGGSWATRSWALCDRWRNWYLPHIRQMFVGFRCAL